ncbi:MAG: hypothetical protein ACYCZL_03140 [Polaromonas sp.]
MREVVAQFSQLPFQRPVLDAQPLVELAMDTGLNRSVPLVV